MFIFVVIALSASGLISFSDACDRVALKVNRVTNCNPNNVIRVSDGFTASIDKQCNLVPKGCVEITQDFNTAKMAIRARMNWFVLPKVTQDGCEALAGADETAKLILNLMGVPSSCPMQKQNICDSDAKKLDLSKYKMGMAAAGGRYFGRLNIHHDTGETCIDFDVQLIPKMF